MAISPFKPRSFCSAAVVITLLVTGVMCSGRAEASCGDYLHSRRSLPVVSPSGAGTVIDPLSKLDAGEARQNHGPLAPAPRPCSGPGCGKAPVSAPLPIVAPVQSSRMEHIVAAACVTGSDAPRSAYRAIPASRAHAEPGFPLLIEVPPEVLM